MLTMQNNTQNILQEFNFDDKIKFIISDYQLNEKIEDKHKSSFLRNNALKHESVKISFNIELNSTTLINVSNIL